jgi:hypothetical protein
VSNFKEYKVYFLVVFYAAMVETSAYATNHVKELQVKFSNLVNISLRFSSVGTLSFLAECNFLGNSNTGDEAGSPAPGCTWQNSFFK